MGITIREDGKRDQFTWKSAHEDFAFGTQLVVQPSQIAVFYRDGQFVDILRSGTHTLETSNLPFLRHFQKLRFGRYFHCQVYFINCSVQMSVPWWIEPKVTCDLNIGDGRMMPLAIGASGTMNLQVDEAQAMKFLHHLVGTGTELTSTAVRDLFASMLNSVIKNYLANVLADQRCDAFTLDRHLVKIGQELQRELAPEFEEYGLYLRKFIMEHLVMPEDDPAYSKAKLLRNKKALAYGQMDIDHDLEIRQKKHEVELAGIQGAQAQVEATTDANVTIIKSNAERVRRANEGITSIQEHQFDTLNHMIDANMVAAASGAGNAAPSGMNDMTGMMSDMMKFGMSMNMMREMGDVMKDTMSIGAQAGSSAVSAMKDATSGGWVCTNGHQNAADSQFCPKCGQSKPAPQTGDTWTCTNGHVNPASSLFCPKCGQPKPAPQAEDTWTCTNGHVNPTSSLFCSQCGQARPPRSWFCSRCGNENSADSQFCPKCGNSNGGN